MPVVRGARAHPGRRRRRGHRVPGRVRVGDRRGRPSTGWPTSSARSARRRSTGRPSTVEAGDDRGGGRRPTRRASRWRSCSRRSPTRSSVTSRCSRCCPAPSRPDDHLVNARTGTDERLHGLFTSAGQGAGATSARCVAGDIAAVAKLGVDGHRRHAGPEGQAGDGRARSSCPSRCCRSRSGPAPRPTRTSWPTRCTASQDEDPGAPSSSATTRPTRPCSAASARRTWRSRMERLRRKFGVEVDTEDVRVRYRETITGPAERRGQAQEAVRRARPVRRVPYQRRAARRGARASSSSTRSSAAPISRGYIPAVAEGHRGDHGVAAARTATRSSTSRSSWSTARSTRSTRPRWRSRSPAGSRSARRWPRRARRCSSRSSRSRSWCPTEQQGDVMGDLNARRGRVQGTEAAATASRSSPRSVPDVRARAVPDRPAVADRWPGPVHARTHDHYDVLPPHLVDKVRQDKPAD